MKAKNILFGILALLTVGIIGVGGYIIGRESCVRERNISFVTPAPEVTSTTTSTPSSTSTTTSTTPSEIDTSDWKTYRNEEYGYAVKYPGKWYHEINQIRETKKEVLEKQYLQKTKILFSCFEKIQNIPQHYLENIPEYNIHEEVAEVGDNYIEIGVAENPSRLPIREWFQRYLDLRYVGLKKYKPSDIKFENFTLSGVKGIKTSLRFPPSTCTCDMFYLPNNSIVYSFGLCGCEAFYAPWPSGDAVEEKIISSFKFIK